MYFPSIFPSPSATTPWFFLHFSSWAQLQSKFYQQLIMTSLLWWVTVTRKESPRIYLLMCLNRTAMHFSTSKEVCLSGIDCIFFASWPLYSIVDFFSPHCCHVVFCGFVINLNELRTQHITRSSHAGLQIKVSLISWNILLFNVSLWKSQQIVDMWQSIYLIYFYFFIYLIFFYSILSIIYLIYFIHTTKCYLEVYHLAVNDTERSRINFHKNPWWCHIIHV